ncbi:MAG: hydroxyacid dehydrogenase [Devosia sp.]|uniref:hydroxyacid dehydrogenase n=1 Tax=Devosia sp. TaxID=1871048 RepID=UPI0024CDB76B|nr:hydroxyacid dehydrogenase [Devosia sp.]UYN98949.1 MAG: hydroxyacid dehydrogenase [Devosia sp.]
MNIQARSASSQRPDAGKAEPAVHFVVVMDPIHVADMLYGPGLGALLATGAVALHPTAFADLDSEPARRALAAADVLITGWGAPHITAEQLAAAPRLKYLLHAGGQAGHVLPAELGRDLQLSNAGWINAIPVAEFTFAMIILANKQAFRTRNLYRQRRGFVNRELEFPKAGNRDKVIGIVGASRIGRIVMERLGDIEVSIKLYDPHVSSAEAARLGAELVSLDTLMASSDIVSLHPPLNETTQGMIGAGQLALMRDGATLINTARGLIVDQDALVAELARGRIEAILDVTHPEVLPKDHPLYDMPNVFLTPHISGSMGPEISRMGAHVASELSRIVNGQPLAFPETAP